MTTRTAAALLSGLLAGCALAQAPARSPAAHNRAAIMAEGVAIEAGSRPQVEVQFEKDRSEKKPADMGKLIAQRLDELERAGAIRIQVINPDGAASVGEYPWMAALEVWDSRRQAWRQFCGGVLVARRIVLSAAHCNNFPLESVRFVLDVVALDKPGTTRPYRAHHVDIHPLFARVPLKLPDGRTIPGNANDFALFYLNEEPPVTPLALGRYASKGDLFSFKTGRALGWGVTSSGKTSPVLLYIDVPIIDDVECGKAYSPLHRSMLCAGLQRGGKDTCQGDSGGPFILKGSDGKYEQGAVISFGVGCGLPNYYGIYSALTEGRAWIEKQLAGK